MAQSNLRSQVMVGLVRLVVVLLFAMVGGNAALLLVDANAFGSHHHYDPLAKVYSPDGRALGQWAGSRHTWAAKCGCNKSNQSRIVLGNHTWTETAPLIFSGANPTLNVNLSQAHTFSGSTGAVNCYGTVFNLDASSPFTGTGRGGLDSINLLVGGRVSLTDANGTQYKIRIPPMDPPDGALALGKAMHGRTGAPFTFTTYVDTIRLAGGEIDTPPFFNNVDTLFAVHTSTNFDAWIATTNPSNPSSFFEVTTPGAFAVLFPPPAGVPSTSTWRLLLIAALIALLGTFVLWQRFRHGPKPAY
jgi:hypothetical protein